jgi:hypothetical protein
MTLQEFKEYLDNNKRIKIAKWNKEREGNHCGPFTDKEFKQSMVVENMKSRTRRTHSRGNLWRFKDSAN